MYASVGDARDVSSIPRLRRFPREGSGNPLQYSWVRNPIDSGGWRATVHGVTKSQTRVSKWTHIYQYKDPGQGDIGHSCDSLPGPLFILEEGLYPQKGEQMWQRRAVTKHKNMPPQPHQIFTCHVIKEHWHLPSRTLFHTFDRQVVCQALEMGMGRWACQTHLPGGMELHAAGASNTSCAEAEWGHLT